jgi:putative flippase GtrA
MRFPRLLKFGLVGGSGAIVNIAILYLLAHVVALPLLVSSALAVECAVISNFLLNNRWTFGARDQPVRRFFKFNAMSLGALSVNVLIVWLLTRSGVYFLAADLAGIAIAMAANYAGSVAWVWRRVA